MAEILNVKPYTHKAEEPHAGEHKEFLGIDSIGRKLTKGDWALVCTGRAEYKVRKLETLGSVEFAPMLKIWDASSNTISPQLFNHVETYSGGHYAMGELELIPDARWKALESYIADKKRIRARPQSEDWYDSSYPVIKLQGSGYDTISENPSIGYITRPQRTGVGYSFTLLFPGYRKIVIPEMTIGESIEINVNSKLAILSLTQGTGGNVYIDVTKVRFKDETSLSVAKPREVKRMANNGDILQRLRNDFAWATPDDIQNSNVRNLLDSLKELQDIDWSRLKKAYMGTQSSHIMDELNEYELKYLALRSYFRLIEFAFVAEGGNVENLPLLTTEERQKYVDQFELKIGKMRDFILEKKREREVALFGLDFTAATDYPRRYASANTIAPSNFLGQHDLGAITYLADSSEPYYSGKKDKLYERYTEVVLHEEGHYVARDKRKSNPNWTHEELWTEWYSVVYPQILMGRAPAGNVLYHNRVIMQNGEAVSSTEKHGAIALQNAFEELVRLAEKGLAFAGGKKILPEDIERSAIATFYQRKERGRVRLNGVETVGFADLYDEIQYNFENRKRGIVPFSLSKHIQKSKFEELFKDCTDSKYDQVITKREKKISRELDEKIDRGPSDIAIRQRIVDYIYQHSVAKQYSP